MNKNKQEVTLPLQGEERRVFDFYLKHADVQHDKASKLNELKEDGVSERNLTVISLALECADLKRRSKNN